MDKFEVRALREKVGVGSRRAQWVMVLFVVSMIVDLGGILAGWSQQVFAGGVVGGGGAGVVTATLDGDVYRGIQILRLFVSVVLGISLLVWLNAAYDNLHHVGSRVTRFTSGWAVGFWLIPVFNLFRPCQVIKELWWRSRNGNREVTLGTETRLPLVSAWWSCWLLAILLARISSDRVLLSRDLTPVVSFVNSVMAPEIARVVAAILAFLVVRRIDQFQRALPSRQLFETPHP